MKNKELKPIAIATKDKGSILIPHSPHRMSYRLNDIESTRHDVGHIYLTDEEDEGVIGDWAILNNGYNTLSKINEFNHDTHSKGRRKIVATNNPELLYTVKNGDAELKTTIPSISKEEYPLIVDALNSDSNVWCEEEEVCVNHGCGHPREGHNFRHRFLADNRIKLNKDGSIMLVKDGLEDLDWTAKIEIISPKEVAEKFMGEKLYTKDEVIAFWNWKYSDDTRELWDAEYALDKWKQENQK